MTSTPLPLKQIALFADLPDDMLAQIATNVQEQTLPAGEVLFHEGQQDHIHISIVARRAILLVIFDERSSLGLVRLRVKRASSEMEQIFDDMVKKSQQSSTGDAATPFSEITDDDIDALFGE